MNVIITRGLPHAECKCTQALYSQRKILASTVR